MILVWAALGAVVAAIASVILALIARRRLPPGPSRWRWIAVSAAIPFALLAYGVVAFLAYAAWCEVRHVDPGLGDEWRVPLAGHYSLVMIDTFEQALIGLPSGTTLPVSSIAVAGPYIAAENRDGPFLIDSATGALQHFTSRDGLERELRRKGRGGVRLKSPRDFYLEHRWTRVDAAVGVVLVIIPVAILLFAGTRLRRLRRK